MYMLILHYAVIQLRYSRTQADPQDQEGRVQRELETPHCAGRIRTPEVDPLARELRARVGRIQVFSTQAHGKTFRVSLFHKSEIAFLPSVCTL